MKKNVRYIMFAMLAVFGLAACDESDYEYTAPTAVEGANVYFPVDNPLTKELDALSGTFTLQISRADSAAAMTVPLTVTSTSDKYTVPEEAVFAAGQRTSEISIDYAGLEYDVMDTITILIDSANSVSPYGMQKYVLAVGAPAPWTPWCSTKAEWVRAGMPASEWPLSDSESTCTYTYNKIFNGSDTDLPISYRKSTIYEEQAQIKIDEWCYGVSIVLDYNPLTGKISVEPQFTGFTDSGVGDFYLTDVTHWQGAEVPGYISTFDREAGLIRLWAAWMAGEDHASCYGYAEEYIQLDGFYIPDYSINAVFEGTLTDASQNTYALLHVAGFGTDAEAVKALVVTKDDDAAAVADAILAGDVEAADLVVGNNKLELGDLTGELQIVAVAIAGDEVKTLETYGFEYYGSGNASPWKSLGKGLYTDDAIIVMFGDETSAYSPETYEVEIQENNENPGLYRLVDPYGPGTCPYYADMASSGFTMPAAGTYLLVNACDPDGVYVEHQSLGIDFGEGLAGFVSEGATYLSEYPFETIKNAGLFGQLKDGVISFPSFDVLDSNKQPTGRKYQGFLTMDGKLAYYAGMNGKISVVLPEAVTASAVKKAAASRMRNSFGGMFKTRMPEVGKGRMVKRLLVPRETL